MNEKSKFIRRIGVAHAILRFAHELMNRVFIQLELNSSKLQSEKKRKKFERIVIMEIFEHL